MPRVGIMGGTFDPIHYGHLAMAEGAMYVADLEKMVFLPNREPPHKAGEQVTPARHRAAMVKLAIADNPRFAFSSMELERKGPSYTVDTVRTFQKQHPSWRIAFVAGMDSLLGIQSWHQYETLLRLIDLIIVARPGVSSHLGDQVLTALGPDLTRRIQVIEIPGVAVSSTELRRRAREGYPLRYLVPDPVVDYIREHQLYQSGGGAL